MLGVDTFLRTNEGDARLGDLRARATLFDLRDRPIEVTVGPPQALTSAYTVLYWPHRFGNGQARGADMEPNHYIADGEHPMFLVAAPGAKALLQ
jgi:hypothetical protein